MSEKERMLEEKYLPVLAYVEAGRLLAGYAVTSGKIRGAITAFCRQEEFTRPVTFVEMEDEFMPDFFDWWLDNRPDTFKEIREESAREAANKYLAFTTVWKAKFKNNEVYGGQHRIQASTMLTVKNTLAASVRAVLSYNKRKKKISQNELIEIFPVLFQAVLPVIFNLQNGLLILPDDRKEEDLSRLIGAFFAEDPAVIGITESLKQIEYKDTDSKAA